MGKLLSLSRRGEKKRKVMFSKKPDYAASSAASFVFVFVGSTVHGDAKFEWRSQDEKKRKPQSYQY